MTQVSTLERLVLSTARCHHVVYKIVAYDEETVRKRLHGQSIVFPQKPVYPHSMTFGEASIKAAFAALRIVFVGPEHMQTEMEKAALTLDDLRLRPEVIFNHLVIMHALHGGPPPPSLDTVTTLLHESGGVQKHIQLHARRVLDTGVELASTPSDVAGVRTAAQCASTYDLADNDPEAAGAHPDVVLTPHMDAVGVFEMARQEMHAVVAGIDHCVRVGGTNSNEQAPDAPDDDDVDPVQCCSHLARIRIILLTRLPQIILRMGMPLVMQ